MRDRVLLVRRAWTGGGRRPSRGTGVAASGVLRGGRYRAPSVVECCRAPGITARQALPRAECCRVLPPGGHYRAASVVECCRPAARWALPRAECCRVLLPGGHCRAPSLPVSRGVHGRGSGLFARSPAAKRRRACGVDRVPVCRALWGDSEQREDGFERAAIESHEAEA
jgi:hypothetical protein